jgi:LysR family cys regulon transcriptional activator
VNLQQLRYLRAVVANGFSVSRAAQAMHTSQPGVSQQIRLLEEELGTEIFVRDKNRLSGLTRHGQVIMDRLQSGLAELDYIKSYAKSIRAETASELLIVTSHTQARYTLPRVLEVFAKLYPKVRVDVRHGGPADIVDTLRSRFEAIGILSSNVTADKDLLVLPYASHRRVVIVPRGHPLLRQSSPSLHDIAQWPLITYEHSVGARQAILDTFEAVGAEPHIILGAIDADVIKACVERDLGIAVVPEIAFDAERDSNLDVLVAQDLFPPSIVSLAINRKRVLGACEYDFIQLLSGDLTRKRIEEEAREIQGSER